jgi:hypothetical protein
MRGIAQDLIGMRSGRIVVIDGPFKRDGMVGYFWQCKCDCGNILKNFIVTNSITTKKTKSCGCYQLEQVKKANKTHGETMGRTRTRTYNSWRSMWQRCTDANHKSYSYYKDKTPVDRWKSFECFMEDMGERPLNTSIERIDNSKSYSPDNCKWASISEQQQNRDTNIFLEIDGKKVCLKEACRIKNVKYSRAKARVSHGWNPLDAIMLPAFSRKGTLLPNGVFQKDST